MSGARQALSFLTPIGGAATPSPRALPWFPVVGAAIGAALGGVWWLAAGVWPAAAAPPTGAALGGVWGLAAEVGPAAVAAAVVVAADLALTGLLHLDGLADSA